MCNPAIALGLGLVGGLLQGVGAAQQRETNAQNYELRNAAISRDIQVEKQTSAFEIAALRTKVAQTQGMARAGYAANGLALSGSAAQVLTDSATEGDLDVATIRWNSKTKIGGMKFEQQVNTYNAEQERAGAGLAFVTPIISGAARFGGSF
jgi:hypothetical protein